MNWVLAALFVWAVFMTIQAVVWKRERDDYKRLWMRSQYNRWRW